MNAYLLAMIGSVSASILMALTWLLQTRIKNPSIVDVAWTYGVGALAVFFAFLSEEGSIERRLLVAFLAGTWSLRLGGLILARVLRGHVDGRYAALEKNWGDKANSKMFWFYQFQAIGCVGFALPMLVASQSNAPLGIWDGVGITVWLVGMIGVTLSDMQLTAFREQKSNQGKVCDRGLWRYSRHPNYFFESLLWWSYFFLSLTTPWGWLTVLAPLTMLFIITRVTGIPPNEAQAIRSRGDAYREYQKTTSAFIPWPPQRLAE